MKTPLMTQAEVEQAKRELLQVFAGMDQEYENLAQGFIRLAQDPDITPEAKNREFRETASKIEQMKAQRMAQFEQKLQEIRERFSNRIEDKKQPQTIEERLLAEQERANKLVFLVREIEAADTSELEAMWEDDRNRADADFIRLVKAELKRRGDARSKALLTKIETPIVDPGLAELDRLRAGVKTALGDDLYTPRLAEEGLEAFRKYHRRISKDLWDIPFEDARQRQFRHRVPVTEIAS